MARTRFSKKYPKEKTLPQSEERNEEVEETVDAGEDKQDEENSKEEESRTSTSTASPSRTTSNHLVEENSKDSKVETTTIKPRLMYFKPTEYKKKIKISTRCHIHDTLTTLEQVLNRTELRWFLEHPQFRHIFHMPRGKNHKLMGMWMLLLRTASIEKKKEAWFIVNGVPIRYGIVEHALLSGLDCHSYPEAYMEMGSLEFAKKHFKGLKTIRIQDVKEKLHGMGRVRENEKLKMAVLYFLGSILIGQTKTGEDATSVHPFFLKAVDDLELCRTFPWGRLSFDHMLGEIAHTMARFEGVVNDGALWPIPGFVIPMEILAFEAITSLRSTFREPVRGADANCPRMCKSNFKKSETRGFPLSQINKELGITTDIDSILPVMPEEKSLLAEITEADEDVDNDDPIIDSWMRRLVDGYTVYFEDMFNEDVAAREEDEAQHQVEDNEDQRPSNNPQDEGVDRTNTLEERVKILEEKVEWFEAYMKSKEDGVGTTIAPVEDVPPAEPPVENVAPTAPHSSEPPAEDVAPAGGKNTTKKGGKRGRINDDNVEKRKTRSTKN